jgi:hypothetical protein
MLQDGRLDNQGCIVLPTHDQGTSRITTCMTAAAQKSTRDPVVGNGKVNAYTSAIELRSDVGFERMKLLQFSFDGCSLGDIYNDLDLN